MPQATKGEFLIAATDFANGEAQGCTQVHASLDLSLYRPLPARERHLSTYHPSEVRASASLADWSGKAPSAALGLIAVGAVLVTELKQVWEVIGPAAGFQRSTSPGPASHSRPPTARTTLRPRLFMRRD